MAFEQLKTAVLNYQDKLQEMGLPPSIHKKQLEFADNLFAWLMKSIDEEIERRKRSDGEYDFFLDGKGDDQAQKNPPII